MKKIYPVSGMHCVSCETLLEKEILELPEAISAKASFKKGELEIEAKEEIAEDRIRLIVEKCGHHFGKNEKKTNTRKTLQNLVQTGFIAIVFLILFLLISKINITRFFPDISEGTGIGIALLLGVVASVSTCLALTGGIVMSFSSECSLGKNASAFERARPQILFHTGRVGGFFLLGGLLGFLGERLQYSVSFTGYLTIFVGLIMLYIGLHILGFVPNITRLGIHLPKGIEQHIFRWQKKKHPFVPVVIGVLTFFLPCGFTQSMQIAAVASGSFFSGALIMGAFAVGTLPVLFGVGMGSSYATNGSKTLFFKKIVGVLIIFFALFSMNSGLVLAGSKYSFSYTSAKNIQEVVPPKTIADDSPQVQTIRMDVDYVFSPTAFRIKKGVPVRWEINAINATGCTDEVIIPRLGISSGKLKPGVNVIEFTPTESGQLPFSCWMGMQGGAFLVEE